MRMRPVAMLALLAGKIDQVYGPAYGAHRRFNHGTSRCREW